PASVKLSPSAIEIVKLASAGLDEKVMLAYLTNSTGTFNLGSDEIIYLTDIGIPAVVIKAMIVRDHDFPEIADVTVFPQPDAIPGPLLDSSPLLTAAERPGSESVPPELRPVDYALPVSTDEAPPIDT